MPPYSCMLTKIQLTPAMKWPKPTAYPSAAGRRGAAARSSSQASAARVANGTGHRWNGAKPSTVTAPNAAPVTSAPAPAANVRGGAPAAAGALGVLMAGVLFGLGHALHAHAVDAPAVGAQHAELQPGDHGLLAALGQVPEVRQQQPADGVVLLVAETGRERFVEGRDLGLRLHAIGPVAVGDDIVLAFVQIELVLD